MPTRTEKLFLFRTDTDPIRFEEYKKAGWPIPDIVQYFAIVDELRAIYVALEGFRNGNGELVPNGSLMMDKMLEMTNIRLNTIIGKHLSRPLDLEITPSILCGLVTGNILTGCQVKLRNERLFRTIHQDDFAVRMRLENLIGYTITQHAYSFDETLQKLVARAMRVEIQIATLKESDAYSEEPELLESDPYEEWQNWAYQYGCFRDRPDGSIEETLIRRQQEAQGLSAEIEKREQELKLKPALAVPVV